jgi:hypothetical protein
MSSYTKYHRAYQDKFRDQINLNRRKKNCFKKYGIPMDMYDELCDEFKEQRRYYLKLKDLNPALVNFLLKKFHSTEKKAP